MSIRRRLKATSWPCSMGKNKKRRLREGAAVGEGRCRSSDDHITLYRCGRARRGDLAVEEAGERGVAPGVVDGVGLGAWEYGVIRKQRCRDDVGAGGGTEAQECQSEPGIKHGDGVYARRSGRGKRVLSVNHRMAAVANNVWASLRNFRLRSGWTRAIFRLS